MTYSTDSRSSQETFTKCRVSWILGRIEATGPSIPRRFIGPLSSWKRRAFQDRSVRPWHDICHGGERKEETRQWYAACRRQKEQPGAFEAFEAVSFLCPRPKRHRYRFYAHHVGSLVGSISRWSSIFCVDPRSRRPRRRSDRSSSRGFMLSQTVRFRRTFNDRSVRRFSWVESI